VANNGIRRKANEASRAESCEKIKKSNLLKTQKDFFSNTPVCPVEEIAPAKIIDVTF
jgi:hypothetical protein